MTSLQELEQTIVDMVDDHRGILAADESTPTIKKRFDAINVESTEESRCKYRTLLLSTPDLGNYISAVILFEETLNQKNEEGVPLQELAWQQKIVPGIKVDKGTEILPRGQGDLITKGLDGLTERLVDYKEKGARFAKWREVYNITERNPTPLGLSANAEMLARYAAACQDVGIVPIVEPEVLMDGFHDIASCAEVNEKVLHEVFDALNRHQVQLELMILKPSMVLPGKDFSHAAPEEVAEETLKVFKRTVPVAVPSINFLSGGQTPEEATANLNAINQMKGNAPWQLSSSYGRALQQPVIKAWGGKDENGNAMQQALLKRAKFNSLARKGEYSSDME